VLSKPVDSTVPTLRVITSVLAGVQRRGGCFTRQLLIDRAHNSANAAKGGTEASDRHFDTPELLLAVKPQ
jgi:hypothetical protein